MKNVKTKRALLRIIKTQSIFRTDFSFKEEKMVEYDYGKWDIPLLKGEKYSREDIIKSLQYFRSINGDDLLPVILVLQGDSYYEIFVSVNHSLWDNISTTIMQDLIIKYIDEPKGVETDYAIKQTYTEYMNKKECASKELYYDEEKIRIYECINIE